jgi:hypothetical protein
MSVNEMIIAYRILYNLHELNISLFFSNLITTNYDELHTDGSLNDTISQYKQTPPTTATGDMAGKLLSTRIACH